MNNEVANFCQYLIDSEYYFQIIADMMSLTSITNSYTIAVPNNSRIVSVACFKTLEGGVFDLKGYVHFNKNTPFPKIENWDDAVDELVTNYIDDIVNF